jgi:hypothetical protein
MYGKGPHGVASKVITRICDAYARLPFISYLRKRPLWG